MKVNIEDKYRVPGLERGLRVIEYLNVIQTECPWESWFLSGYPHQQYLRILLPLERGNYVQKKKILPTIPWL